MKSIVKNRQVKENCNLPMDIWLTDHKALLVTFKLKK